MFATNANAQIKFGLKGGLDVTNMSTTTINTDKTFFILYLL